MIIKHTVSFAVPCSMAASMTLLFLIFPAGSEALSLAFRQLLTGSFLFTAFFVATDHATTPITLSGRIIYGCLCGMLTFMIRRYSGLTEGVFFAVCIADLTVPFLDKAGAFILRLHSLAAARIGNIFRKKGGIV